MFKLVYRSRISSAASQYRRVIQRFVESVQNFAGTTATLIKISVKAFLLFSVASDLRFVLVQFSNKARIEMTRVTIGLALCAIAFAMPLYSQPVVAVTPWSSDDVTFRQFDPDTQPAFAGLFQHSPWETQRSYAFLLENNSRQGITALTIIWRIAGGGNKPLTRRVYADSYGRRGKPALVRGNGQAVVTPIGTRSAELAQSRFSYWSGSIPNFEGVTHIEVSLDTVIFADGRVIGPDESQTVDSITSRKTAAEALVADVRTTIAQGWDVNAILLDRSSSASNDPLDYFGSWTARFANKLLTKNEANRLSYLTQIENLPQLPTFFRIR